MKNHIIQVITELEPAGAERVLTDLSVSLLKKGYSVSVISLQGEPKVKTIINELAANNISVTYLNVTKKTPWRILRLIKIFRDSSREGNQIVHSHMMHANLACRIARLFTFKFKLINTIHIAERRSNQKIFLKLDKITLPLCNIYTAVSKAAADWHLNQLKIKNLKIDSVNNGIRPIREVSKEEIQTLLSAWGLDKCAKIIGSLGRLDYQKGYDILFKILPELSIKIPKGETWGVVILGEGERRRELEKLKEAVPENIKIALPGYRADAPECIAAFDLFVMPSRYEGFGLTLLEALVVGVPVLASSADSLPELISYSKSAECIDFTDSKTAVEKILEYIDVPGEKVKYSDFSIDKMTENYIDFYKRLFSAE